MSTDAPVRRGATPALVVFVLFAGGIVLASTFSPVGLPFWLLVVLISSAAYAVWQIRRKDDTRHPLSSILLFLILPAMGAAYYAASVRIPSTHLLFHVPDTPAEDLELQGRVQDFPVKRDNGTTFTLQVQYVQMDREGKAVSGRVQVTLTTPFFEKPVAYQPLERGQVVRLKGRLRRVPPQTNPGSFDRAEYLGRRGIYHTLWVNRSENVAVVSAERSWIEELVVSARNTIEDRIEAWVPGQSERALPVALLLGDRSRISRDVNDQFIRTGLLHLLAVSGLHVMLVGMVLYGLLRPVLLRLGCSTYSSEVLRTLFTMAVLLFYMVLTGSSASVVRAVVMTGIFVSAPILKRPANALNSLGAAGLILLIWRPTQVFEVGFQLSFAAVGAIILLSPVVLRLIDQDFYRSGFAWFAASLLATSIAATLGTLPILLFHFGRAALGGIVLNLLAIPLTMLLLAATLLCLIAGALFPGFGMVYGHAVFLLSRAVLKTAEIGDRLFSWAIIETFVTNGWFIATLVVTLLTLAAWHLPRLRWKLLAVAMILAVTGVATTDHFSGLEVTFFDVGNADAVILRFPNGRSLVVDTGAGNVLTDHGSRVLIPYLRSRHVRSLDAIVVTHADNDHSGGLASLLRGVHTGRLVTGGCESSGITWNQAMGVADSLGIPRRVVAAGDTLFLDPTVRVYVLSPERITQACENDNDQSIVLSVVYGSTRFLLMGDAGTRVEEQLVRRYGELLKSDVIKAGHHGSRTSSSSLFVRHIVSNHSKRPLVVMSAAAQGKRGLPDDEVLTRWKNAGANVWITGRHGALTLRSDGNRITHHSR